MYKSQVYIFDLNNLALMSFFFQKHPKPRFITSLAFTDKGEPITGDSNGNLFLWNPSKLLSFQTIIFRALISHLYVLYIKALCNFWAHSEAEIATFFSRM